MLSAASAASLADPLAPKDPHFAAKAKSVIWLHMDGAPSTQGGVGKLFATPREWTQYGDSGAWFSDLMPTSRSTPTTWPSSNRARRSVRPTTSRS